MRTLLRIVVIGLWTVAGFCIGVLMLYFGGLALLHSPQSFLRPLIIRMPEWLLWTFILTTMAIPTVTPAVLGLFELLPGTRKRRVAPRQGFPIEISSDNRP